MTKKIFLIVVGLWFNSLLWAQTNEPVRLALISENEGASTVLDVLTAQLSSDPKIHLLERDEIDKVYREQELSAGNTDYLKLGRILGADGLLLLQKVNEGTNNFLNVRLIAVRPGVVLTAEKYGWPLDLPDWSSAFANHINPLLPKLTVLVKDAIPISVVNFRSAIPSGEASETEAQLKLLTIQRLSQERQFFVLERQKMQSLSEEKTLNADESGFWSGSYLLDGVIDQNGYSKDIITINARLTPPKGGVPILFEITGNRTNFTEVINRLAAKIVEALKINSTVKEWNAADEASQFYDEAKWALKWKAYSEAQAAANSAWALGKKDLNWALVRTKAYSSEILSAPPIYETSENNISPTYDVNGKMLHPITDSEIESDIQEEQQEHPFGLTYRIESNGNSKTIHYIYATRMPDPEDIDRAQRALEIYYSFSLNSPDGMPKILWRGVGWNDWHNSEWYNAGVEDLVAASVVLQNFNLLPFKLQKPVAEKLADLRALARSVAKLISESPTVHDSYYINDRVATHDELANTIGEDGGRNIFSCEATWGCFWQETPEDCIMLYCELMSSPAFCYIHSKFWFPDKYDSHRLPTPRIVAWNDEDKKRLPTIWKNFIQMLDTSTNFLWQMEGQAIALADSQNDSDLEKAFNGLFDLMFTNEDAIVANDIELLYLDWGTPDLISQKCSSGIYSPVKEKLEHEFKSDYYQKLEAMDQAYWNRSKGIPFLEFENQKQFLEENEPYDFLKFARLFTFVDYSKKQAKEISPLIASYESNLVAQVSTMSGLGKNKMQAGVFQLKIVEDEINRILNPPATKPQVAQIKISQPPTTESQPVIANTQEAVTNVIVVNKFFAIPLDSLYQLEGGEKVASASATITAHHWCEGKLLLDFQYNIDIETRDEKGVLINDRRDVGGALAIFTPAAESWKVIALPQSPDELTHIMSRNSFYHRSVLWHGVPFNCDDKRIRKYNFAENQWETLSVSDNNNYELFVVNDHLYAANQNIILEIADGGNVTRILASRRREPPASLLDAQEWGVPTLISGSNQSLRLITQSEIYTWTNGDWRNDSKVPPLVGYPEVFADGVIFRRPGGLNAGYQNGIIYHQPNGTYGSLARQDEIFSLGINANTVTVCLAAGDQRPFGNFPQRNTSAPKPLWRIPENFLPGLPLAWHQSGLFVLEDSFSAHVVVNERHELLQDGITNDIYNAALLCFFPQLPRSQKLFLRFNTTNSVIPNWLFAANKILFFGVESPIGEIPVGSTGSRNGPAGIWLIPLAQIEPAIIGKKEIQLTELGRATVANEQARQQPLLKYDLNHNGVIDLDERETALSDPAFIESELNMIDANQNNFLDADELVYFDANTNKILDSNEQAGIDITERLLAAKWLKQFDANGDGVLDRSEFEQLRQSLPAPSFPAMTSFDYPDRNRDGQIDLDELTHFLKRRTQSELIIIRVAGTPQPALPPFNPMGFNQARPGDSSQMFKAVVERYWQYSGNTNNPDSSFRPAKP